MRIITKLQAVGDDCGLALTFRRPLFGSPRWRISMSDVEELVQSFIGVWNETDPQRRREIVRSLWRTDGRHLMGVHDVEGHEALEQRVASSNQRSVVDKNYVFRPATDIQALPGVVKFRWDMARRDTGEVAAAGVGFLTLDQERRIRCDYLFTES